MKKILSFFLFIQLCAVHNISMSMEEKPTISDLSNQMQKLYLNNSSDPNAEFVDQQALFNRVCEKGEKAEMIAILKDKNFSKDHKNILINSLFEGSTPLHKAAFNGHSDIVRLLIACESSLSTPDINNETPLDQAIVGMVNNTYIEKSFNMNNTTEWSMNTRKYLAIVQLLHDKKAITTIDNWRNERLKQAIDPEVYKILNRKKPKEIVY